jgi:hypothetical protein
VYGLFLLEVAQMTTKPTYEELKQKVRTLEKEVAECKWFKEELSVVYDALNSSAMRKGWASC